MKKFFLMAMAIVAMSVAAQEVNVKPFTVRYIDEDRLYQQYVVAQQYLQLQAKLKNDFQQAEQKKRKQIETFYNQVQNFYNQVQTKYKNGQYKTQKAFEADQKKLESDQKKLEQMQENAQKEMEAMQKQMEQQLSGEQVKLANEIDLFLADFAVKNDYDAILRKEAAMFINPRWDVTDKVAEGLNARYNSENAPTAKGVPVVDGKATDGDAAPTKE
ncbi:MAG: OmpH family outer membrane protein [Muribaculaceae bacterium]|nr:OmpH family outer membrane protein [Muribaculaceae bacterium]